MIQLLSHDRTSTIVCYIGIDVHELYVIFEGFMAMYLLSIPKSVILCVKYTSGKRCVFHKPLKIIIKADSASGQTFEVISLYDDLQHLIFV